MSEKDMELVAVLSVVGLLLVVYVLMAASYILR